MRPDGKTALSASTIFSPEPCASFMGQNGGSPHPYFVERLTLVCLLRPYETLLFFEIYFPFLALPARWWQFVLSLLLSGGFFTFPFFLSRAPCVLCSPTSPFFVVLPWRSLFCSRLVPLVSHCPSVHCKTFSLPFLLFYNPPFPKAFCDRPFSDNSAPISLLSIYLFLC